MVKTSACHAEDEGIVTPTGRQSTECSMEDEYKLLKVHYEWLLDIVKRMEETILMNPDRMNTNEKLDAIMYLIKQAKKVERED